MKDSVEIDSIVQELLKITGKCQFSFATKLVHTCDPKHTKPIWDQYVGEAIGIKYVTKNNYQERYNQLENIYEKLFEEYKCAKQINILRKEFGVENDTIISNEKILDFILWGIGMELKKS